MMPTSLRAIPYILASALLVLSMSSCSSEAPDNAALIAYLKSTWGITVTDFEGEVSVAADGTQSYSDVGRITVDGLGSHQILSQTVISPRAQGGDVTLFVSNIDGSDERYFLYDDTERYITIGSQTKGVAIDQNPDGTYNIWAFDGPNKEQFLTAPDGFEALRIVEQYNEFKTISPYILLSAFASAHTATPEARVQVFCNAGLSRIAAELSVCEIFKEFCDCAACLVLKRQGACSQCPKL